MMKPTEIPFTQYVRPYGKPKKVFFDAPKEIADMAHTLIAKGYTFNVEMIGRNEISLTVSDGKEDVAIELSPNGPGIENAVTSLVQAAHKLQEVKS